MLAQILFCKTFKVVPIVIKLDLRDLPYVKEWIVRPLIDAYVRNSETNSVPVIVFVLVLFVLSYRQGNGTSEGTWVSRDEREKCSLTIAKLNLCNSELAPMMHVVLSRARGDGIVSSL